jgi:hypothetical protein
LFFNRRAPRIASFPDFTVRVLRGARGLVSIVYEEEDYNRSFEGELTGSKHNQINMFMTSDFPAKDLDRVVANLVKGFEQLGYEYWIRRRDGAEVVPESEREAALFELRRMGWEADVSVDRLRVEMKRIDGAHAPTLEEAMSASSHMAQLVQALHGTRYKFDDLARSKSAQR